MMKMALYGFHPKTTLLQSNKLKISDLDQGKYQTPDSTS